MESIDNLWLDEQKANECLELHLPYDKSEEDRWLPSFNPPSMALYSKPIVEVHSRPTPFPSPRIKDIKQLRDSLAIKPLRNITRPSKKGASLSENLPEKILDRGDNRGPNLRNPSPTQADSNPDLVKELYPRDNHKANSATTAGACHYSSTEPRNVQGGPKVGGMELDVIQKDFRSGM